MLAIIAFIAYAAQYTQKINMSVAIVCMINNTALKEIEHAKQLQLQLESSNNSLADVAADHSAALHDSYSNDTSTDKCYFKSLGKKKAIDGPFNWSKQIQYVR